MDVMRHDFDKRDFLKFLHTRLYVNTSIFPCCVVFTPSSNKNRPIYFLPYIRQTLAETVMISDILYLARRGAQEYKIYF